MRQPTRSPGVDEEHALIVDLLAGVDRGTHAVLWASLRQALFPGEGGWVRLKAWCATRALECELSYGQSSKTAEVLFRKTRPAAKA